jgi:anti-sigma B factor antagonist
MRELGIEGYGNFLAYLSRRGVGRRECYAHSVGVEQPAQRGTGRRHNDEREAVGLAEEGRIAVHYLGHVRVVALVGEHDLSTVDGLSDEIERQFRTAPHVVVDLTRATFVDSTVVCALALGGEHARARSACRFAVVAAPDSFVHKVFDMVDLRDMMPTYETLEEALADGGVIQAQTRLRPV